MGSVGSPTVDTLQDWSVARDVMHDSSNDISFFLLDVSNHDDVKSSCYCLSRVDGLRAIYIGSDVVFSIFSKLR